MPCSLIISSQQARSFAQRPKSSRECKQTGGYLHDTYIPAQLQLIFHYNFEIDMKSQVESMEKLRAALSKANAKPPSEPPVQKTEFIWSEAGFYIPKGLRQPTGSPCWNCDEEGHGFDTCTFQRRKSRFFCIFCGKKGIEHYYCICKQNRQGAKVTEPVVKQNRQVAKVTEPVVMTQVVAEKVAPEKKKELRRPHAQVAAKKFPSDVPKTPTGENQPGHRTPEGGQKAQEIKKEWIAATQGLLKLLPPNVSTLEIQVKVLGLPKPVTFHLPVPANDTHVRPQAPEMIKENYWVEAVQPFYRLLMPFARVCAIHATFEGLQQPVVFTLPD